MAIILSFGEMNNLSPSILGPASTPTFILGLIHPFPLDLPKANAGADVVVNRKKIVYKAVSIIHVWVCLKAMTTEKPMKEK